MDCEYTCWPDSEATMWADPEYPCETIQIGLMVFDFLNGESLQTYSQYIRPKVNWNLSDYCKNLLKISQKKIDQARDFPTIAQEINNLLRKYGEHSLFLCSWGKDWDCIADDAKRNGIKDPFNGIPCMDLRKVSAKIFGFEVQLISREIVINQLDMPKSFNRHDALGDALELKNIFLKILEQRQKKGTL